MAVRGRIYKPNKFRCCLKYKFSNDVRNKMKCHLWDAKWTRIQTDVISDKICVIFLHFFTVG